MNEQVEFKKGFEGLRNKMQFEREENHLKQITQKLSNNPLVYCRSPIRRPEQSGSLLEEKLQIQPWPATLNAYHKLHPATYYAR